MALLREKLGHNQTYVSRYEIGEKRVDLIELKAICKALRIGLVDFVERFARTPKSARRRRSPRSAL